MEQALEQVGVLDVVLEFVEDRDLAVHEGLQAPGQIDEDLDLLFAARVAGELGRLDDGGDGHVLGARHVRGQQFELVGARTGRGGLPAGRRPLALTQLLDETAQFTLPARTRTAQDTDPLAYGSGRPVGGHGGDHDAYQGDEARSGEDGPEGEPGAGARGADGEENGRAATQGDGERGKYGKAQKLGPYVGLGLRGDGPATRPAVPTALSAVCAGAGGRR